MIFAAGNHHETTRMACADFEQLVHPRHTHFSAPIEMYVKPVSR